MSEIETTGPSTDLVITADQTRFNEMQVAALHQLGVQDAPQGDLALFFHHAKRTGLDPFAKQIYMIGRWTRENDRAVMKYTIQTGIDGLRVIGDRASRIRGDELEHDDTLWCGDDGVWQDVWLSNTPPAACKYAIRKNGHKFSATVLYHEFVQRKKNGEPNSMWAAMPCNQLAKCAEAQAWRKVYPADFSGLLLEGTDRHEVVDGEVVQSSGRRRGGGGVNAVRQALKPPPPGAAETRDDPVTNRQSLDRSMFALLRNADVTSKDDGLAVLSYITGQPVTASGDLTDTQVETVIETLTSWNTNEITEDRITDIINTALIRYMDENADDSDETTEGTDA